MRKLKDAPPTETEPKNQKVGEAYRLLMSLTDNERGDVFCWFCPRCYRHVPPGDHCNCQRDE